MRRIIRWFARDYIPGSWIWIAIHVAAGILVVILHARAQTIGDPLLLPPAESAQVYTPNDNWTVTSRPMSGGGTQSIWNSDSGKYMLCTARPMGDGRAVISCD